MPESIEDFWSEAADTSSADSVEITEAEPEFSASDNSDTEIGDLESQVDDVESDVDDNLDTEAVTEDDAFDWSAYADRLVPIVVDGVEEMVPLSELRNGYMRQSAWTQRTQRLAEAERDAQWARDMRTALQSDPMAVLNDLAAALGVNPATLMNQPDPLADVDEDLRPIVEQNRILQQRLDEIQNNWNSWQEQQQVETLKVQVRQEIDQLSAEYGDNFDPQTSLRYAIDYNIPLRQAAAIVYGEKVRLQQAETAKVSGKAGELAATKGAAAEAQRQAAKKRAAGDRASFKVSDVPTDDFEDIGQLMTLVMENQGA